MQADCPSTPTGSGRVCRFYHDGRSPPSAHLPVQSEGGTNDLSTRVRVRILGRPAGDYARPGTEPARELEFGGGRFQFNPLAIDDISRLPVRPKSQPRVHEVAERADGLTVGVTPVLGRVEPGEGNEVAERAFFTCGRVTWRRRSGPPVGVNVGPWLKFYDEG